MLRNHSRRSLSPCSCSPLPVFEGSDPDWIDGQEEQSSLLRRDSFHRRLKAVSGRRDNDDYSALYKWRKSPEGEEVEDAATFNLGFEPHSSWRFYTSFDNGEWRRHAVPVSKVKDVDEEVEINGLSRPERGFESTSDRSAAESILRRTRQSRTTAAELLQQRRRGSGCLGDGVSHRAMAPRSVGSFRSIAPGAGRSSTSSCFEQFARDTRRSLSPGDQPMESNDVIVLDDDVIREDFFLSKKRWPFEGFELTGSVKINGVESALDNKIIVPTKYKSTVAVIPEIKISTDPESCFREFVGTPVAEGHVKTAQKDDEGQNETCMVGLGQGHMVDTASEIETVSADKNHRNEEENSEKLASISGTRNKNSGFIDGRRTDALRTRKELLRENSSNGLRSIEAYKKEIDIKKYEEIDRHKDNDINSASEHLSAAVKSNETDPVDDGTMYNVQSSSREINSEQMENNCDTPSDPRVIQGKKEELFSKAGAEKLTLSGNVPDEKIANFVNTCTGQIAITCTKSTESGKGSSKNEVASKADEYEEKGSVSNGENFEEFDEWIVEMAVRD